jgi:16S rRNA (uracil1498-N3)-methyltransferase
MMSRFKPRKKKPPSHSGAGPVQAADGAAAPAASMARYAAPGDEAIAIDSALTLQQPFRIGRGIMKRLERRGINPSEAFTIRDQTGTYFRASLKEIGGEGGSALPYERMERSPEPTIEITLACSVLARQRMIFVMQKATELGVTRIVPLLTDHSVPREGLEHERAHSWPAQVIRAAKQCRRASLPHVVQPATLDGLFASPAFAAADVRIFLDDRSIPVPTPAAPPRRIVLIVGPEGGFSDPERARLPEKASPWVLGGRILRAETAVIVGLTAVNMVWGDFGTR